MNLIIIFLIHRATFFIIKRAARVYKVSWEFSEEKYKNNFKNSKRFMNIFVLSQ